MEWFRNAIGLTTASFPTEKNEPPKSTSIQDAAALLRKKRLDLSMLREDIRELNAEIEEAGDQGNARLATEKIQRRNQLEKEARLLEGQIRNHESVHRTISNASANKEQALLMRDGANQLDSIVNETEKIDLDDIVDRLQDGAAQTHDFSSRLSEPLFSFDANLFNGDGQDVDDEVAKLMQRKAEEKTAGLSTLGTYSPKVIPSKGDTQPGLIKRVVPREEIKEKDN